MDTSHHCQTIGRLPDVYLSLINSDPDPVPLDVNEKDVKSLSYLSLVNDDVTPTGNNTDRRTVIRHCDGDHSCTRLTLDVYLTPIECRSFFTGGTYQPLYDNDVRNACNRLRQCNRRMSRSYECLRASKELNKCQCQQMSPVTSRRIRQIQMMSDIGCKVEEVKTRNVPHFVLLPKLATGNGITWSQLKPPERFRLRLNDSNRCFRPETCGGRANLGRSLPDIPISGVYEELRLQVGYTYILYHMLY